MPNWCHDTLTVTGEPEAIAAFAEKVKVEKDGETLTPLTFEAHAPRADTDDWYSWSIQNWGTKRDASFSGPMIALGQEGMDLEKSAAWTGVKQLDERTLSYKFDTAWSPPVPWLEKVSEAEPELELSLTFAEVGNGFAGRVKYVSGVVVEEEDLEVEDVLESEEMWF